MLRFFSFGIGIVIVMSLAPAQATDPNWSNAKEFAKALFVAQAQVPEGQLITGRAESGPPLGNRFGFYFYLNGRVVEIEVGLSGQILKRKEDDPAPDPRRPKKPKPFEEIDPQPEKPVSPEIVNLIDKKKAGRIKLPEGRLLEIAGNALNNTPLEGMKYVTIDGKLCIQIGTLILDAQTGEVVKE